MVRDTLPWLRTRRSEAARDERDAVVTVGIRPGDELVDRPLQRSAVALTWTKQLARRRYAPQLNRVLGAVAYEMLDPAYVERRQRDPKSLACRAIVTPSYCISTGEISTDPQPISGTQPTPLDQVPGVDGVATFRRAISPARRQTSASVRCQAVRPPTYEALNEMATQKKDIMFSQIYIRTPGLVRMATTVKPDPGTEAGRFASQLTYSQVPDESIRMIENVILDTVGVTLAGVVEGAGETAADTIAAVAGDEGEASIIGRDQSTNLLEAGFVNGTSGHCLDYDDMSVKAMNGHPSVVLVPGILAVAETEGVSGEEAIAAYAAGYEVMSYLGQPILPSHYSAGWHATGTLGAFGSAAAVSNLLGLTETETVHALNIAASMAAGLRQNFGTMTKPMHVGQATRSGLTAAYLARDGFTASEAAIGGEDGFLDAYSGEDPPDDSEFFELGEEWALTRYGLDTKKYPACGCTHASIAAAQALVEKHDIAPADVERVHVKSGPTTGEALLYDDPQTGFQGKFSMEYAVASAIVRESVGIESFRDDSVNDPEVQAIRERVTSEVTDEIPHESLEGEVTIETKSGETFREHVSNPPGSYQNPLTDEEYREKFMECAVRAIDESDAESAADFLMALRDQDDVGAVFEYI